MDARPPVSSFFDAFGVPATVTPPNEAAITTTVVWISPEQGFEPPGAEWSRRDPLRILALRRSEVPRSPVGTLISAPEIADGSIEAWRVDGMDRVEADHVRVVVVRA